MKILLFCCKGFEMMEFSPSERGGELKIKVLGDRVKIAGKAVLFSVSELYIRN